MDESEWLYEFQEQQNLARIWRWFLENNNRLTDWLCAQKFFFLAALRIFCLRVLFRVHFYPMFVSRMKNYLPVCWTFLSNDSLFVVCHPNLIGPSEGGKKKTYPPPHRKKNHGPFAVTKTPGVVFLYTKRGENIPPSSHREYDKLGGRNSNIFYFHPEIWGRFPIWLIFFKWVETTK